MQELKTLLAINNYIGFAHYCSFEEIPGDRAKSLLTFHFSLLVFGNGLSHAQFN